MPVFTADGNDVTDIHINTNRAVEWARNRSEPVRKNSYLFFTLNYTLYISKYLLYKLEQQLQQVTYTLSL